MATTYSGSSKITSTVSVTTTGYGAFVPQVSFNQAFTHGIADDQFDHAYFADLVVVDSSTPKDLDLIGGGLTQPDGSAFAPVEICEILIKNNDASATLTVGAGSAPWISWLIATGDGIKIPPGGVFHLIAPNTGYALTATTADGLRIATSAGTNVSFTIHIKGRSA